MVQTFELCSRVCYLDQNLIAALYRNRLNFLCVRLQSLRRVTMSYDRLATFKRNCFKKQLNDWSAEYEVTKGMLGSRHLPGSDLLHSP